MLPLTALPAAQTALATPDVPAANGETAQNSAGFGALLAALGRAVGQPQPPADPAGTLSEVTLPGGNALPEGGKELPGGNSDNQLAPASPEALPETVALGLPMIPGSAMINPETATPPDQAGSEAPRALPAQLTSPRPSVTQEQAAAALPMLEVPEADLPKAARELVEAARPVVPARPVANLRVKLGEGVAESPARSAASDVVANTTTIGATPASAASPALTTPATPLPAAQSAAPLPLAEAAQRPQDFAQLIDRLVAAREAAAPQAAAFSLAHAEFGRVDLTFASDGQALSVNLSSPDPDFARAVQAAAQAATTSDHGSNGSSNSRQSGQPEAGHNGLSGQTQGQAGEQRQGRRADQPQANQTMPRPDRSAPETGIFA